MSVLMLGQERDRAKIEDKYKWDLTDIYPGVDAWRAAKDKATSQIPSIRQYAGKLGSNPQVLADALETMTRLDKELSRLYVYASMVADEDTRQSEPQGMQQEMEQTYAEFGAQAAYIEPEVLRVPKATIDNFLAAEPRLKPYAF
jgi:oligoendopeptidase F